MHTYLSATLLCYLRCHWCRILLAGRVWSSQ